MSAIWGAIDLENKKIADKTITVMQEVFSECVIDRYEELIQGNVYMGCGIQYFTVEAEYEKLPLKEDENYFCADVILDNRGEIFTKLGICLEERMIPDGELLFKMVKKYGEQALDEMLGAYVFVQYDKKRNQITIGTDAAGNRYVYYMFENNILYFSSLMAPLEKIMEKRKINERWISDFIGEDSLNIFLDGESTPFEGIYRIAPANVLTISLQGIKKRKYWDPTKIRKKIRYRTDEEYKEHFLKLYQQCVTCVLRSPKETALFLSGGFDSTSVACIAAPYLEKEGKKLYSFTSVPFKGYESEFDQSMMVDETEAVRKTSEVVGNLECEFMDMPEMNSWDARKEYIKISEFPYKSPQNVLWLYEGLKKAYEKDARIMLGGMFGNGTVSYSNIAVYFVWLFKTGRWIRLYEEIKEYNKSYHYTKKSMLMGTIKTAFGIGENDIRRNTNTLFERSFAKKEYLEENGTIQNIVSRRKQLNRALSDCRQFHNTFFGITTFRQYSEFAQKNSLYSGVIIRDPTRDKRMIEFVLSIPYHQFTHSGYSRRLITEYMKDIMPSHIIKERKRGRQSADLRARLLGKQDQIMQEWISCYKKNLNNRRIDCAKALEDVEHRKIEDMMDFEVVRHIFTNILLEYLNEIEKE